MRSAEDRQPAATGAEPPRCELTILLPCLDEQETIRGCVEEAVGYLTSRNLDGEVVVADNGSRDDSARLAREAGARVVRVEERGYGSALRGGIAAARGRYVIMGDADGSYSFADLDPFLDRLRAGDDLVMGNRFRGGIVPGAMPRLNRYLGNPLLSFLGRVFYRSPVGDFHCGLRGFRRDAVRELGLSSTGMEFASELVVKATLHDLTISEVPVTLSPDGRSTRPHLRRWRDGWRHVRFLLLLSPRWLFLYPGAALALLGLFGMLWLLPGPHRIGSVGLDVNTLLYCSAAMIGGYQAVTFSLIARTHAVRTGLLPPSPLLSRLTGRLRLEGGLLVGLLLIALGLAGALYSVRVWKSVSFGPLNVQTSMRIVIPATTLLILGVQTIWSSFLLELIGGRHA